MDFLFKSLPLYGADKSTYLISCSGAFKPSLQHYRQVVLKAMELDTKTNSKIHIYYDLVKELVSAKDSAAKEVAASALALGDSLFSANTENYEFLKYYAGLYGISAIDLGNETDRGKARLLFAKCRRINPSGDDFVSAWVAQVGVP